jgi:hypothetical protein
VNCLRLLLLFCYLVRYANLSFASLDQSPLPWSFISVDFDSQLFADGSVLAQVVFGTDFFDVVSWTNAPEGGELFESKAPPESVMSEDHGIAPDFGEAVLVELSDEGVELLVSEYFAETFLLEIVDILYLELGVGDPAHRPLQVHHVRATLL